MNTVAISLQEAGTSLKTRVAKVRKLRPPALAAPVIAKQIPRNEHSQDKPANPYSNWSMPDTGSGFIKARKNDCW